MSSISDLCLWYQYHVFSTSCMSSMSVLYLSWVFNISLVSSISVFVFNLSIMSSISLLYPLWYLFVYCNHVYCCPRVSWEKSSFYFVSIAMRLFLRFVKTSLILLAVLRVDVEGAGAGGVGEGEGEESPNVAVMIVIFNSISKSHCWHQKM